MELTLSFLALLKPCRRVIVMMHEVTAETSQESQTLFMGLTRTNFYEIELLSIEKETTALEKKDK